MKMFIVFKTPVSFKSKGMGNFQGTLMTEHSKYAKELVPEELRDIEGNL